MEEIIRVPIAIYRGGTSKGIFIKEEHLPDDPFERDRIISRVFGSPDKRQIDGLGGADPLTSKVALIGPPSRDDANVDFTFGQVDINSSGIAYFGACGNITAAVGPYAIDQGLVPAVEPVTEVRIHNKNNGRIIRVSVPVRGRSALVDGDYSIDGVPGSGARIEIDWSDSVGAGTGSLLPTGKPQDVLSVPGVGKTTVSIVDVGNPGVFVRAADLGLTGAEAPEDVDSNRELIETCNSIASEASKKINSLAMLSFVAPPADYVNHTNGAAVRRQDIDFLTRMILMGCMHKTYSASQTTCCGTAARIPGTVVNEVARPISSETSLVRLGHPAGVSELEVELVEKNGRFAIPRVVLHRTARRLLEGTAFVRK